MPKKTWQITEILFSESEKVPKGAKYNADVFHRKIAAKLNELEIGPGEFSLVTPERIRDTPTYRAYLYLFTDKEVKISWVGDKPI